MKIVVTGHHGYIGSLLVRVLTEAGHEVTGIDTFLYRGCDLTPDEASVRSLSLDVRDVQPEHLLDHDAVVHLAALSNDPLGDLDPQLTADINFRATVRVARAAKEAGVQRFVFSSSCSMYGASGDGGLVGEDAPLRPLTAYAESKVRSEEALSELADESFAPVFMRNATAYGVSPRLRVDLVLNNLVAWAHTRGAIRIMSDGTPWRPLVHIEDISRAVLCVLDAPANATRGRAFNVGSNEENYQVRDLAETVREVMPDCLVEYAGSGDPDPRSYRVDFGAFAREFPEFRARWNARRGAEELAAAYRAAGLNWEDFDGPRYTRLKRLRELRLTGRLDERLRWRSGAEASRAEAAEAAGG